MKRARGRVAARRAPGREASDSGPRLRRGTWSSLELLRLRDLFPRTDPDRLARLLNRSTESVVRRGRELFAATRAVGPWTEADDGMLRTAIGIHDVRTIAVLLGRPAVEVRKRVVALRRRRRAGSWTHDEDRQLRKLYGTRSTADLGLVLSRGAADIESRARELCLGRDKAATGVSSAPLKMPRWTVDEIKRLRQLYPKKDSLEVAKALGRTVLSVRNKAWQLGLGKGPTALASMGRKNVAQRHGRDRAGG